MIITNNIKNIQAFNSIQSKRFTYGRGSHIQSKRFTYGLGSHIQSKRFTYGRGSHIQSKRFTYGRGSHIQSKRFTYGRGSHTLRLFTIMLIKWHLSFQGLLLPQNKLWGESNSVLIAIE